MGKGADWAALQPMERARVYESLSKALAELGHAMPTAEGGLALKVSRSLMGMRLHVVTEEEAKTACCRRRVIHGSCHCAEGLP